MARLCFRGLKGLENEEGKVTECVLWFTSAKLNTCAAAMNILLKTNASVSPNENTERKIIILGALENPRATGVTDKFYQLIMHEIM